MRFKKWLESVEINWTLPVMNQEMPNIQKSTQSLKLDPKQLKISLDRAKLLNLPNNVWSNTKNIGVNQQQINRPAAVNNSMNSNQTKNTKVDLKAPVVLMTKDNKAYLVSGNDSFQAARKVGSYPKALVALI
jgi:hypothetical protein